MTTGSLCSATASCFLILDGDGSLSPETRLVLVFETGLLTSQVTDDQTACAFCVSQLAGLEAKFRCTATGLAQPMARTVGLG